MTMFLHMVTKKLITKVDHPSDLAPCNFWLFQKLKNTFKGKKIADILENEFRRIFLEMAPLSHELNNFKIYL